MIGNNSDGNVLSLPVPIFFPQPAVPVRWILLSAVKTQDPESSQSSLCLATDDLYLIPVFLCICTALVSSLLLCHPLCLPVAAYLPFIRGFLSSFTSPPPSHPIPPRHSHNLSAHLLVIPPCSAVKLSSRSRSPPILSNRSISSSSVAFTTCGTARTTLRQHA